MKIFFRAHPIRLMHKFIKTVILTHLKKKRRSFVAHTIPTRGFHDNIGPAPLVGGPVYLFVNRWHRLVVRYETTTGISQWIVLKPQDGFILLCFCNDPYSFCGL